MTEFCVRCDHQIGEHEMAVWVTDYPTPYCAPCFEQVSGLHVHQPAPNDPTVTVRIEHSEELMPILPGPLTDEQLTELAQERPRPLSKDQR